jgi:hypothetical protein
MTKQSDVPIGQARSAVAEDEQMSASYIAEMTEELARLARAAELGVLAYLLDMAATEARGSALDEGDGEAGEDISLSD